MFLDYDQIIEDINNNFDIKITKRDKGLAMVNHHHPVSITQSEFSYIYHTIKQQNLKNGYELATAFGISGLAASLAFKETNGKIVTMDAYIEEKYNNSEAYHNIVGSFIDCDGYRLANFLYDFYNTKQCIKTTVGWSPNDTRKNLSKIYDLSKDKLDYVFIDAGHWDEYLIHDIASIVRFLDEHYYIFIHDLPCFSEKTRALIETIVQGKLIEVLSNETDSYGLGLITNI